MSDAIFVNGGGNAAIFVMGPVLSIGGGSSMSVDNDTTLSSDSTVNAPTVHAAKTYIDNAVATVSGGSSGGGTLTGIVSGGRAIWVSGYTYKVTAASYYIGGTLYSSAEQSITLDAPDATYDRIDVLALDDTGTLIKITGTPATAPSEPDIDASTQIEITFVTVATGTSAPATAVNESIYAEGAEWTGSVVGTHITLNSTNNPNTGTKDIEATSATSADAVLLTKSTTLDPSTYSALVFYIRSKTANWSKSQLRISFQDAAGARVGAIVSVLNGSFGFSTSNTASYQAISIPLTAFSIPAGTLIQKLNIAISGSTAIGWYLDDIALQASGTGSGSTSGLTQTQADARYAQRSANLSDLANASAARTNLGLGTAATLASDTDSTLAANSDARVPTQKAVKAAIAAAVGPGTSGNDWTETTQTISTAVASVIFTGLDVYNELLLVIDSVTASAALNRTVYFSIDGGTTWESSYIQINADGTTTPRAAADFTTASSASAQSLQLAVFNNRGSVKNYRSTGQVGNAVYKASASPINAIKVVPGAAGNLTGGKVVLSGR